MHNFEDENLSNDDFELEFSDLLSEDEMHSISGKLVAQSSWLWTKAHELAYTLFAASSRLTSKARTWLLTDVSKNTLAQRISSADFEVEIMDLPSDILDSKQNVVSKLVALEVRFSPKIRLWRLAMMGCTLLLLLAFILNSFPPLQTKVSSLFRQPIPTPTPAEVSSISLSQISVQGQEGTWQAVSTSVAQVPVNNIAPGPVPQDEACPERPTVDRAQEVGRAPVWVADFSGPSATMYLFPTNVPVDQFPTGYGWTASVLLEIQASYKGPVTLSGNALIDDSPILFSFFPNQEPTVNLPLDTQYPVVSPDRVDTDTQRVAWNIVMYVPAAGCYTLHASWHGGKWQVNFAAGR